MKWLFISIAFLNLFDGMITSYGLANHYIEEANPLMTFLWELHPLVFVLVKIGLSGVVLFLAYMFHKKQIKPGKITIILWTSALFIYLCILALHITWLSIVFLP